MPKRRYIDNNLDNEEKNFFIVDANFIANKYLPSKIAPSEHERARIDSCKEWWKIIDNQVSHKKAIIYIPNICVAEVIKVFSKKYYQEKRLKTYAQYKRCLDKFTKEIRTPHKELAAPKRHIRYHDISTSRDILISVERFNRIFHNNKCHKVTVPDLIIVATAKYLMDFYCVPYPNIHILTLDKALKRGSNKVSEIPTAYDPSLQRASSFFK